MLLSNLEGPGFALNGTWPGSYALPFPLRSGIGETWTSLLLGNNRSSMDPDREMPSRNEAVGGDEGGRGEVAHISSCCM
jgi:hypothetical protein